MPVSVHLHLNVHISVRCSSLTNMDLRVSMRSQSYKFAIGSSAEDMLDHLDYAGVSGVHDGRRCMNVK